MVRKQITRNHAGRKEGRGGPSFRGNLEWHARPPSQEQEAQVVDSIRRGFHDKGTQKTGTKRQGSSPDNLGWRRVIMTKT